MLWLMWGFRSRPTYLLQQAVDDWNDLFGVLHSQGPVHEVVLNVNHHESVERRHDTPKPPVIRVLKLFFVKKPVLEKVENKQNLVVAV